MVAYIVTKREDGIPVYIAGRRGGGSSIAGPWIWSEHADEAVPFTAPKMAERIAKLAHGELRKVRMKRGAVLFLPGDAV